MRACYTQIAELVNLASYADGAFAEFGVWHGDTFEPLAKIAKDLHREAYAIDSFAGMATPSNKDVDETEAQAYCKGALDVGGSKAFRDRMKKYRNVIIYEGFIPAILERMTIDKGLAFSHVDLDHYGPTVSALLWAWKRTNSGGIVCCHDWFPDRNHLASGGAKEFMEKTQIRATGIMPNSNHIWWKKP